MDILFTNRQKYGRDNPYIGEQTRTVGPAPPRQAWDFYNEHAVSIDRELENDWNGDLDALLVVVSQHSISASVRAILWR